MSATFYLANFNVIAFSVWIIFFTLMVIRFSRPAWVKNISYAWLVAVAVSLHLLYGVFATWGQYVTWGRSEFTKVFLSSPLSKEVPFPSFLEWTRPLFDGANGYFAFYSFQHFFLSTVALFFITGLFVLFFKIYAYYRPALFKNGDMLIIAVAFLFAGWMGSIVLVPLAFIVAILVALFDFAFNKTSSITLAHSFLVVSPLAVILATPILKLLGIYMILKL